MLSLAEIAISVCRDSAEACQRARFESILFFHLKVQKEAQLTTSERLQVQKENALTERAH